MINQAPLWLVGLLLFAAMILAFEGGMRLHHRIRHHADGKKTDSGNEIHVMSGVFGMLALLMAFSFGLALDRYEQRRELVVAEANAIETLSSRLTMVPQDLRQGLSANLARYAVTRAEAGQSDDPRDVDVIIARAEIFHHFLGAELLARLAQGPADSRTTLLVQAYDAIGAVAAERRAARAARLPGLVLALLILYCVAGAEMLGYTLAGSGGGHRLASGLFFALLAFAFVTILDLDRPRGGAIRVPQDELERIARNLVTSQRPR